MDEKYECLYGPPPERERNITEEDDDIKEIPSCVYGPPPPDYDPRPCVYGPPPASGPVKRSGKPLFWIAALVVVLLLLLFLFFRR